MEIDLYNLSPAACAVQDDARLLAVYGLSIIEIIKDNQTIHFGCIKGQAIHQYVDITYDTMDKESGKPSARLVIGVRRDRVW
jgi:hypothetical protein